MSFLSLKLKLPFPFISPISCYYPILSSFSTHFKKSPDFWNYSRLYSHIWRFQARNHLRKHDNKWKRMNQRKHLSLCVGLTSLSLIFFQFFPFTWEFHDFTFLYSWLVFQVYVHPIFIIQLSVEGHLVVSISQLLWTEPQRTMLSKCL